ncbi:MAG TPA: TolC family protein [Azospirillaceae bacterium]|nr:TolC family protein [Azospirillaceae bacterium]
MTTSSLSARLLAATCLAGVLLLGGCTIKPEPLTLAEEQARAEQDLKSLRSRVEPVSGPVTLDEAIARALKYNLDHRLQLMEVAVANRQLDLSRWDLLPKAAVSAGLIGRTNESASSSLSVLTRQQSLEPSTSLDKGRGTADLQLTWSVLDFGLSYYQARQNADRALATAERRRVTLHSITQQVRNAYWQAVAAERVAAQIEPVLADARRALENAREIERQRLMPPLDALRFQKGMIEVLRQLEGTQAELVLAKAQLSGLMGLPPGTPYQLAYPASVTQPPEVRAEVPELERIALVNRPELREQSYQRRVSAAETRKALLRLLPNLGLNAGAYYDSNSYLVNQTWAEGGLRVSWSLMNLLTGRDTMGFAEAQMELGEVKRLALAMTVLTQVNVAWQSYGRARTQFTQAAELDEIERRIYEQVATQQKSDAEGDLERIRSASARIAAELTRHKAYADMQNALASLYVSVGVDPLPGPVADDALPALTKAVADANARIEAGTFALQAPTGTDVPAEAAPAAAEPGV